jgi:hypothetical protein
MSVKGEKYTSKKSMMKHEKTEPMSARVKEYGKKAAKKSVAKKSPAKKSMGKKK